MKIKFAGMALLLLIPGILAGCGGGGSSSSTPAASTLSGIAAVGYPIVSGNVAVKCASGSPLTTTTSSAGEYNVTISGQTLPCAVEVGGGTANGIANTTKYHSIATTTGTVNVTPLTDLMVANLAAGDPSAWFNVVTGATLTAITPTQVSTSLTNLRAALTGLPALGTINPITTNFTAISGNVSDDMLAALGTATAGSGGYAALLTAAGIPASFTSSAATLNAALPAAYAGTTSGSLPTIASLTPSSGAVGASVMIAGTNFSTTPANNIVKFNGVAATVTSATAMQLVVTVPAAATTGAITVLVGGQTATSATSFTVTAAGTGTNVALVGTWKMTFYKVNTSATVTNMSPNNMILVLAANGDWTFTQPGLVSTCQQSGTSTSTATTFTFTTVSDPCTTPTTAGKIEASTYIIDGVFLISDNGTATYTYEKQVVAVPTITSFTPASGAVGATVTITGTNFGAGPAGGPKYDVKFNGVAASVSNATATEFVVTVPATATTGRVSVTTAGGTATSATSFTVSAAGTGTYVVQGGLTWMPVSTPTTYAGATALCAGTIIGQTGWRLPTKSELSTLYTSGAMNGQGWTLHYTWSSTPSSAPSTHFIVSLLNGLVDFADDPLLGGYVSCVR